MFLKPDRILQTQTSTRSLIFCSLEETRPHLLILKNRSLLSQAKSLRSFPSTFVVVLALSLMLVSSLFISSAFSTKHHAKKNCLFEI